MCKNFLKSIMTIIALTLLSVPGFAQKIPDNVQDFIEQSFPRTNFRFDGVITLPDNTVYLPLFPAKNVNPETLEIKETYPENKTIADKPYVVIFNNDFVLLKLLTDIKGHRTVYSMANPPLELLKPTPTTFPNLLRTPAAAPLVVRLLKLAVL